VRIDTQSIDFVKIVLIAVILILVISQVQCGIGNTPEVVTTIKVETKLDTIYLSKTKYIPQKKTIVDTIYQEIPAEVDTLTILKDYFSKVVYRDTINIDTFGTLVIEDTISRNLIISRELFSNIVLPTTTVTKTTLENKRILYAGASLSGNREVINQLGVGLMLKGKNDKLYGLGLGLNSNLQPLITGSIYWKVSIRKPKLKLY
tara:strand:+ start:218 stop:829 length:612 start_codon:yes stop_codon:yes gene_type:complete